LARRNSGPSKFTAPPAVCGLAVARIEMFVSARSIELPRSTSESLTACADVSAIEAVAIPASDVAPNPAASTARIVTMPVTSPVTSAAVSPRAAIAQPPVLHRRALGEIVGVVKQDRVREPVQSPTQKSPRHF